MWKQGILILSAVAVSLAVNDGRAFQSKKNNFQKQEPHQFASVATFHQSKTSPAKPQEISQVAIAPQIHSLPPSPYSFGYDAEGSSRQESSDASGKVTGSYKVTNEDGSVRVVNYIADENGFRADIDTNEPGTKSESPADVELKSGFVIPDEPQQYVQQSSWQSKQQTQYEQKPVQYDLGNSGAYSYNYESQLEDGGSNAHSESSDGSGRVVGQYSLSVADGRRRRVDYSSGQDGFQASVDTNEFGTKSESPAHVQFYSSAPQEAAAAPATYSKTNFQQQKQEQRFSGNQIQQQSKQAARFDTSPIPFKQEKIQQQVQDYSQYDSKPSPYSFSYDAQLEDGSSSRTESADASGKVVGSYSLSAADGRKRTVNYVADHDGFRASVDTSEFGTESDSPADVQLHSTAPKEAPAPLFNSGRFSQMRVAAQVPVEQTKTSRIKTAFQPQQTSFAQNRVGSGSQIKSTFQPQQTSFAQNRVGSGSQIKSTFQPQAAASQYKGQYQGQAAVQYGSVAQDSYSPYSFNYVAELEDGGSSSRTETSDGSGRVAGSYSLSVDDGRRRTVDYLADQAGFRATVNTNEFGTKSDSPADVQFYSSAVQEEAPATHRSAAASAQAGFKSTQVGFQSASVPAPVGYKSAGSSGKASFVSQQSFDTQQSFQPSPYAFNYEAEASGGSSSRSESSDASGTVTGSYTVRNEDGSLRVVEYIADENGFRANVKTNEAGTKSENPADVSIKSDAPAFVAPVQPRPQRTFEPVQQRSFKTSEPVHQRPRQPVQQQKQVHSFEPIRPVMTSEPVPVQQKPVQPEFPAQSFSQKTVSQKHIDAWSR